MHSCFGHVCIDSLSMSSRISSAFSHELREIESEFSSLYITPTETRRVHYVLCSPFLCSVGFPDRRKIGRVEERKKI